MTRASKVLATLLGCLVVAIVAVRTVLNRTATGRDTPASPAGGHGHHATTLSVDWTRVSDRDLDIAELFVLARRTGVAPALDALESLVAGDTALREMGHVIAHGLGRFAVAQRQGDPAVYADCREVFQAGCNHGVIEAYFASPRASGPEAVAPLALDSLCGSITRAGAAKLVSLECAHGMGHGLLRRYHGDARQALGTCDHLTQADARRECHDGVFMENVVRATTSPEVRVGDAAVRARAAAHEHKPLVRLNDLRYPCDDVEESYRAACWRYQPVLIYQAARGDEQRVIDTCERSPEGLRRDCYFGIGKQASAWREDQNEVAEICARVPAAHVVACIAGAVESYLDEMWTVDRALAFCATVGTGVKQRCYEAIGERLAIMRNDYAVIERECGRAEEGFVPACVTGVARVWLRR